MKCKKCDSVNILVSMASKSKKQGRGLIWWALIGWWFVPIMWLFFTVPMLILSVFGVGRRNKVISVKTAICQNCGNSWRV